MADAREHYRVGDPTTDASADSQDPGSRWKTEVLHGGRKIIRFIPHVMHAQSREKYIGTVTGIHDGLIFIRLQVGTNAITHSVEDRQLLPRKKDDV